MNFIGETKEKTNQQEILLIRKTPEQGHTPRTTTTKEKRENDSSEREEKTMGLYSVSFR